MLDAGQTRETLLEVNNIEVIYNHVILVLKGVSLNVPRGGITALLGGNGAGKTTTLKAISSLLQSERGEVTKGSIKYRGESVEGSDPADLVRKGVIQVMEGRHCFEHLTVEENLLTGYYTRKEGKAGMLRDLDMVYTYFPRLKERRRSQAGYTSGGEQQMVAIGRAMMAKPETILLDEPSMGLAPQLVEEIFWYRQRTERERGRLLPAGRAEHQRGAALCPLRLYPGKRPGGDGWSGGRAAREPRCEGILPWCLGGGSQELPRGAQLSSSQAVAELRAMGPEGSKDKDKE